MAPCCCTREGIRDPVHETALRAFVHPPEELRRPGHAASASKRALLSPTRALAARHNTVFLADVVGEEVVYPVLVSDGGGDVEPLRLKAGRLLGDGTWTRTL